ncbi:MAG: M48 family metalloprotease [Anaerolineae bacterium]|nr:M48 family metalloprotease [Anaerolineae bacterium]
MFKIGSEDGKPGRIQQWYYDFVMQRDRIMLDDLKSRDLLRPHMTTPKIIAFMIAGLIHSVTIILPIIGLWIILSRFAGYFSVCYGLLIFGIAYVIRPKLVTHPTDGLSRTQYPTLYEFVDQISDTLSTPHIDVIVINEYPNASLGTFGLRQSTVLTMGYFFWMELDEQKRVAFIGHELAHQINNDSTRGLFVGTALHTLINWYQLIYPDSIGRSRFGFFAMPVNLLLWAIANGIFAMYLGLNQILLYERRRAEYLADYIGATAGGTQNAIDMLRQFQRSNPQVTINAFTTHPSFDFRIEFLTSKKAMFPKFVLQPEYAKQIDKELEALAPTMEARKRQKYKGKYNDYI